MEILFWFVPLVVGLSVLGVLCCWWWGMRGGTAVLQQVRDQFLRERRRLETMFFEAASASGKPRGLRWKQCQWNDLIEWIRHKETGQFLALVGVSIAFEAIEGGDMEGVEAVGNLRNATAVFFFDGVWRTVGRVVFNLDPAEALKHFQNEYERAEDEGARRARK